jgi:hypothetical protein
MSDIIHCACGKSYSLRDAWVGTRAYCPHCGRALQPAGPPAEGLPAASEERFELWKSWNVFGYVKIALTAATGAIVGSGFAYQMWQRNPGDVRAIRFGLFVAAVSSALVLIVSHGLSLLLMPADFYRLDPRGREILNRFNVASPLALKLMILLAPVLLAVVAGVIVALVLQ